MSYTQPAAYDQFMGRWSAGLTSSFLRFADLRDGQHILDVGCGTGSLSRAVVSFGPTTKVTALDPAPDYVAFARQVVPNGRAQFQIGTAEALPFPDRSFDSALALLVLQEFADPRRRYARWPELRGGRYRRGMPVGFRAWAADVLAALAGSRSSGARGCRGHRRKINCTRQGLLWPSLIRCGNAAACRTSPRKP